MEARKIIIVEGENDKKFILSLAQRIGINIVSNSIKVADGVEEAKQLFKTYLKSTDTLTHVSIVLDSDNNFIGTWQSLFNSINNTGKYQLGKFKPDNEISSIIRPKNEDDIIAGIWLMPDKKRNGMMEDFICSLIPVDNSILNKAGTVVDDLDNNREQYYNVFKSVHKSKAKLYTWLSWQDSPEKTPEQAIKSSMFDDVFLSSESCKNFIAWLRDVAEIVDVDKQLHCVNPKILNIME